MCKSSSSPPCIQRAQLRIRRTRLASDIDGNPALSRPPCCCSTLRCRALRFRDFDVFNPLGSSIVSEPSSSASLLSPSLSSPYILTVSLNGVLIHNMYTYIYIYILYYTIYIILYIIYYILYFIYYMLYIIYYSVYIYIYYILEIIDYMLPIIYYLLYILYIICCVLFILMLMISACMSIYNFQILHVCKFAEAYLL